MQAPNNNNKHNCRQQNNNMQCQCSRSKCASCHQCQCNNNYCVGSGVVQVRIFGFNESGFSYVISRDGEVLERAVSISVTGLELIATPPFARPRTIAGVIRSDGSIFSGGENFDVSHSSATGSYQVTFKPSFSMIMPDERPNVEVIPNPGLLSSLNPDDIVADIVSGTIMADGEILQGTTLPDGTFAFDVIKNPRFPGFYTVKFKPDLNVTLLIPAGLQIEISDLESPNTCCICSCQCSNDIVAQGVAKQDVDRTGFTYRTFEETFTERIYTDLPINFTALLNRKVN
ncbi:hypothetical protein [Lysinibacillus sp. NPDC092081]|uniref:hypothetical protein n=1 Tax=Lysinibacillus sp. NPDC092081 TaxID=3364131 RepID=UPI00380E75A0